MNVLLNVSIVIELHSFQTDPNFFLPRFETSKTVRGRRGEGRLEEERGGEDEGGEGRGG